ncbi:MAG: hypothetical protein KatS3mg020_1008 [Fimbriimonadales bacterium]|nr:MAG: hypothetical protein KatS3mg020_1008 [Fimbriimonadales bacterium]
MIQSRYEYPTYPSVRPNAPTGGDYQTRPQTRPLQTQTHRRTPTIQPLRTVPSHALCALRRHPLTQPAPRPTPVANRLLSFPSLISVGRVGTGATRAGRTVASAGATRAAQDGSGGLSNCTDHAKRRVRGYDGGKQIKGRKRYIAVDSLPHLHAIAIVPIANCKSPPP